jgi:type IV pilus assembly protein PilO
MAFSEAPKTNGDDFGSEYPSAFGVTFTPMTSGICLALIGICGAGYMLMNMVLPAQTAYNAAKADRDAKQAQLTQLKGQKPEEKIAQLKSEMQNQQNLTKELVGLFSDKQALETLLIDVNTFMVSNQAVMSNYQPVAELTPITDSSLGAEVNGKLQRKSISLEMEGDYQQTLSIVRDLERLQPFIILKDYGSQSFAATDEKKNQVVKLKTKFTLDAIVPVEGAATAPVTPATPPATTPPAQ